MEGKMDAFKNLREHLDRLPGGYPATESGVEIRILKRLFSPEEAELATHLTPRPETAAVIAGRFGGEIKAIEERLKEMARKGLIFSIEAPDRPAAFMASQFVVGIWEYHVNSLDREFLKDMDEYFPTLAKEAFEKLPQLRTVPVGRSIQAGMEILSYENVEELVRKQKKFLVAPCICRREHEIKGDGCGKLMDTCLVFGWGADYYQRNGIGRMITLEETLDVIKRAEEEGLVLQPSNSQEIVNICCCCGDCCQILVNLKRHPAPALLASSVFVAQVDRDVCIACETCLDRCQMGALSMVDSAASLDEKRCIGCGLCVSTCPSGALSLRRKPVEDQPILPKNPMEALAMRARAREAAKAGLEEKAARHGALSA